MAMLMKRKSLIDNQVRPKFLCRKKNAEPTHARTLYGTRNSVLSFSPSRPRNAVFHLPLSPITCSRVLFIG